MTGKIRARFATNITRTRTRILKGDGKEYFDLWMELGTLPKVSEHLYNSGIVNPRNGLAVHPSTIWQAAMRWVLHNPDDARLYFEEQNLRKFPDAEWESWLVEKAMKLLGSSRHRFFTWIRQRNFQKYEEIFKPRFGEYKTND